MTSHKKMLTIATVLFFLTVPANIIGCISKDQINNSVTSFIKVTTNSKPGFDPLMSSFLLPF